jgi:hypothetical protein
VVVNVPVADRQGIVIDPDWEEDKAVKQGPLPGGVALDAVIENDELLKLFVPVTVQVLVEQPGFVVASVPETCPSAAWLNCQTPDSSPKLSTHRPMRLLQKVPPGSGGAAVLTVAKPGKEHGASPDAERSRAVTL